MQFQLAIEVEDAVAVRVKARVSDVEREGDQVRLRVEYCLVRCVDAGAGGQVGVLVQFLQEGLLIGQVNVPLAIWEVAPNGEELPFSTASA